MKSLFTLCLLLFTSIYINAQNHSFIRTYGGEKFDDSRSIVAGEDGTFVITGLYKSGDDPTGDMYLMKINAAGAVLWKKFYGWPLEDGGNDVIKCKSGGYLISGHMEWGDQICDGYIVRTDEDGNQLWSLLIGSTLDDLNYGVFEHSDGSFYLTGQYQYVETQNKNMLLAKVSADGKLVFQKNYGHPGLQYGLQICESSDGNILMSGYTDHDESEGEDATVLKLDLDGNLIWRKEFGSVHNDRGWGIISNDKGGCYLVGGSWAESYEQAFLAELDANGELLEYGTIHSEAGQSYAYDISRTNDGGFVITGRLKEAGNEYGLPCVVFLDKQLNFVSRTLIKTENEAVGRSVIEMNQGEYMLIGQDKPEPSTSDILIARFNRNQSSAQISEEYISTYSIYPNPFNNFTYIRVNGGPEMKEVLVYNLDGRVMHRETFTGNEMILYKNDLAAGTYIFVVNNDRQELLTKGKLTVF